MKKTCSLSPIRRQAARCFSGFLSLFFCKLHAQHQRQSDDAGNPMKAGESQRSLRFFQRCRSHHDCIEGSHHHADNAVQRLGAEALQANLDNLYNTTCSCYDTKAKEDQVRYIGKLQPQRCADRRNHRNVYTEDQKQGGTGNTG